MGNLTGGDVTVINTSAAGAVIITEYTTSAKLATALTPYLTSASSVSYVTTQLAPYATSASVVTYVAAQILPVVQNVTPVNGASTTVNADTNIFYVSTAGTLASVTVVLTTAAAVTNHQLRIATKSILTSINYSGATMVGASGTLAAGGGELFLYDGTNFIRIG